MTDDNTKKVAGNAMALSTRMLLTTVVGLYTSRLVLDALGVTDYGVYSVVGSVVGIAAFLNTSMAGATSRFITVDLESGDEKRLSTIFSTAFAMHLVIAAFVVLLAETIGLWFLNTKMAFPEESKFAANVLYQLSVASVLVSFTQVPYSAAIIAHEKMSIYAKYEILNALLKLGFVMLILRIDSNRLILYGIAVFVLSLIGALFFRGYCMRHFEETRLRKIHDRHVLKEMLGFSGYNLIGNAYVTAKAQGEPILLNYFFGVVANAGATIAATVTGAVGGMTTTIAQAFRPQIMKQYAAGNIDGMQRSMHRAVAFTLSALSLVAVPFLLVPDKILWLWLGQIPPFAGTFLRLLIVCALFDVIIYVNTAAIQATGKIRHLSASTGLFSLACPIVAWFLLKAGYPAWSLYAVNIAGLILIMIAGWWLLGLQIPDFALLKYISTSLLTLALIATLLLATYCLWKKLNCDF